MTSKHTPGPWRRFANTGNAVVIGSRKLIVDIGNDADAALIAAAPELLAAIEQIARLSETADRQRLDVASMLGDIARAALAKVEA